MERALLLSATPTENKTNALLLLRQFPQLQCCRREWVCSSLSRCSACSKSKSLKALEKLSRSSAGLYRCLDNLAADLLFTFVHDRRGLCYWPTLRACPPYWISDIVDWWLASLPRPQRCCSGSNHEEEENINRLSVSQCETLCLQ